MDSAVRCRIERHGVHGSTHDGCRRWQRLLAHSSAAHSASRLIQFVVDVLALVVVHVHRVGDVHGAVMGVGRSCAAVAGLVFHVVERELFFPDGVRVRDLFKV